jgi:zinc transport system substrate-binding protein
MKRTPRSALIAAAALLSAILSAETPKVIASTTWTAAIAMAGGAGNDILVIAPADLKHPAEYEIKPSDLLAMKGASLVVYGGYEKFAQRILEASDRPDAGLKLNTDNRPITLIMESRKVAEKLGTQAAQEKWAEGFMALAEASRSRVLASLSPPSLPKRRVAAHQYLKVFMTWMGFDVVGTFGPGEPSPAQILEIAKAKPVLIIDNYHSVAGLALAESIGADYCALINFPGKDGTRTIEDVYRYNERALLDAQPLKAAPGKR